MDEPTAIAVEEPPGSGQPVMRWSSRTHSLAGIEAELARIWASTQLTTPGEDGEPERRVGARTSVLNLVVIARQPELGARAGALIGMLTGRHPSRTLVVSSADPDGPSWLDANVQAQCVMPRAGAPETCAEFIDLVAGGEAGRHVAAIVAPLLIHDLPVTMWWPGDPPLASGQARELLAMADRLVVDGSHWSGTGLDRLRTLAGLVTDDDPAIEGLAVSDFAMLRQSRWREAIASSFDRPELRPFLRSIRTITVRYAVSSMASVEVTNVIKPLYHVAWLASRLGMHVVAVLLAEPDGQLRGTLRAGRRRVEVGIVPQVSSMAPGTTLAVEIAADRRGGILDVTVTAEAEAVIVRTILDGAALPVRRFMAPRRAEVELLAETIESVGRDPVAAGALLAAAQLAGPVMTTSGRSTRQ